MIFLHIKFHIRTFNNLSATEIKMKYFSPDNLAVLLEKNSLTNLHTFSKELHAFYYNIQLLDSIASISEFCVAFVLVTWYGIKKYKKIWQDL